jgi:hypothetical protein
MKLNTDRRPTMIKTQVVKENNKPVAVIMDYKEYLRLKEIAEDRADYYSAAEVDDYSGISAVLYSSVDCANKPETFGGDFVLVHNTSAKNKLQKGTFRFGREYWIENDELKFTDWTDRLATPSSHPATQASQVRRYS